MIIWIDADACPKVVSDIIITAAIKRKIEAVYVANKALAIPPSDFLRFKLVPKTPDAADHHIYQEARDFDLVITQDIPLAHSLVSNGLSVIDYKGRIYTSDNVNELLARRDLMQELRDIGEVRGGPKPFNDRDKRLFAGAFDRELTRLISLSKQS